jgi:hypothetical protein
MKVYNKNGAAEYTSQTFTEAVEFDVEQPLFLEEI